MCFKCYLPIELSVIKFPPLANVKKLLLEEIKIPKKKILLAPGFEQNLLPLMTYLFLVVSIVGAKFNIGQWKSGRFRNQRTQDQIQPSAIFNKTIYLLLTVENPKIDKVSWKCIFVKNFSICKFRIVKFS